MVEVLNEVIYLEVTVTQKAGFVIVINLSSELPLREFSVPLNGNLFVLLILNLQKIFKSNMENSWTPPHPTSILHNASTLK